MKRLIIISVLVIVVFITACDEETIDIGPPEGPYEPTSPALSMCNFFLSFRDKDIGIYRKAMSPNFTFHFNPSDVGTEVDGYIIPETWGYEDDWTATNKMLDEAYEIDLQMDLSQIGIPTEGETEYTAENISITLLVMIDVNSGFIANKGTCNFAFETYDNGGKTYWRISDWWDGTAGKEIEPASIGKIKAYYAEKD